MKTKFAARGEGNKGKRGSVQLELGLVYHATDAIPTHQNPIYDAERSTRRETTSESARLQELEDKNAYLEYEAKNMKESHDEAVSENEALKKKVWELEAQVQQRKANEMCDSVT